jgi:hypothetical protein
MGDKFLERIAVAILLRSLSTVEIFGLDLYIFVGALAPLEGLIQIDFLLRKTSKFNN